MKLDRYIKILALALIGIIIPMKTALATDYVFVYNNNYLSVNANGAVANSTSLTAGCVWTCVSNTSTLAAASLDNTNDRYLYTIINGQKYWLQRGNTTNGTAITVTTTASNATGWRNNNNRLYDGTRYVYYRGNSWRTSSQANRNNNNAYSYNGTDYRSTTTAGTNQNESSSTQYTLSIPTLTPTSVSLYNGQSQTFTGNATVTSISVTIPQHSLFNSNQHYYNGILTTNADDFAIMTPGAEEDPTSYNWSLSSTDNASLSSGTVTVTSAPTTDQMVTLTCTARYTGHSQNLSQSATATVFILSTNPAAPTIVRFGDSQAKISCSSFNVTIYYTTDGSTTPSTSSTEYTDPFDIDCPTTTVKAIAVRDGHSSTIASTVLTCKVPMPIITLTGANATIAGGAGTPDGTKFYYTTDGTTPTAGSTEYTGGNVTLTNTQTIKVIAIKSGYASSDIASADYIVQGVSGDLVILDDRENHRWSYYSDASTPSQLHSLNPADVKITYYGNGIMMTGSDDYTASSTDYITSTHEDYKVGAKVNVGGENENTFIYYKTLERTDGSTSANPTGRCPYKPIPNPFQVRPRYKDRGTTDANDFTGWRGFQCWRLKSVSGGSVYSAATGGSALTTGAVINAETEIFFAPTAEYGMEVELEAVWAIAYVKKANQGNENPVGTNNVGYERNFCVPTTGAGYTLYTGTGKRITNANHVPVTISCYYPDGTAPDNTANSISNTATSLTGDTKFENIPINLTSNTLTLANYDIIIGRGCGTSTINNLQGINAGATDLDYSIRVESGTFNQFCFVRSGTNTTVSGRYLIKAIMGSDYDRATNTNNKLVVSQNSSLFFAQTVGFTGSSNKDQKTFDCVFKSGTYQSDQWDDDQSGTNGYLHIAYLGQNSAQGNTYPGVRCVTVEGGDLGGMCGGRGVSSNSNSSTYMTPEVITFDLRIKGGTFHGGVFGGAADNPSIGSRRFIMTGGEIWGWLAGGCNGTGSQDGQGVTNGNSYIYVGGTALVGGNNAMSIQNTNGGQVFGAGRGFIQDNGTHRQSSVNNSYVAIADEAVISNDNNGGGNVYGGSYNGIVANEANVYILGGTVQGSVFGGSYGNINISGNVPFPKANVTMTGGLVTDGVYGGSNSEGTVVDVEMHINGGQVGTGTGSGQTANIHGGGFGQNTIISGNVDLTLGTQNQTEPGVTVYGDVYGGSALGTVNTNASNHTNVTLNKGIINGSLYGGALGDASTAANVNGPVHVKVYGGSVRKTDSNGANGSGGVYGANNIKGAPQNKVEVDIFGTDPAATAGDYALFAVYGGGNAADYTYGNGYPKVTVSNCDNSIEYVYGGGNAAAVASTDVTIYGGNTIGNVFGGGNGISGTAADVDGNTNVLIAGGTIERVFGGSNSKGTIGGTINVKIEKDASGNCPIHIGEVYGGGNMAPSNAGNITIKCTGEAGETIDYVYGGANEANITGDILLNITGGRINNVFGGNNTSGTISGTITVNVDWSNSSCTANYLGNVYGGGNLAAYEAPTGNKNYPQVNILCGTVSGSVFGGGNGDPNDSTQEKGSIDGNPQVTIGNANTSLHSTVIGNVYGGGNAAKVKGNTFVMTKNRAQLFGNIYGGGNMAPVTGDTKVIINGTINQ